LYESFSSTHPAMPTAAGRIVLTPTFPRALRRQEGENTFRFGSEGRGLASSKKESFMDLLQRVERLERRNLRSTAFLASCLLVGGVCLGAAQGQRPKPSETIDAKALRLFDEEGNLRALLAVTPKGNAGLTLVDKRGKVCAVLGVAEDANPSLELSHSDKSLRVRLALAPDGRPVLDFYDAEGKVLRSLP
jgi:hypothetical protein